MSTVIKKGYSVFLQWKQEYSVKKKAQQFFLIKDV